MWPALLGAIGGVAVALLARVPAFQFESRSRTRIQDLAALHKEIPEGASQRSILQQAIDDDLGLFLIRRQLDAVWREWRPVRIQGIIVGAVGFTVLMAVVLMFLTQDVIAEYPSPSQPTARRILPLTVAYLITVPTVLYLRVSVRTYRLQRLARQLWNEGERYPIADEVLAERHPSLANLRPKPSRKAAKGG